jgi:hypothetical protein
MAELGSDPFDRVRRADPLRHGGVDDAEERIALDRVRERVTAHGAPAPERQRRRGRRVSLALAGVVVAIGLVALVASLVTRPGGSATRAPSRRSQPVFSVLREPGTSVLTRPVRASNTLPDWIRTNATLRYAGVDAASGRLALRTPGRDYYVARAQNGAAICLIDAVPQPVSTSYRPGDPGGVTCRYANGQTQRFAQGFVTGFLAVGIPSNPAAENIVGVVPDGFTQVRVGSVTTQVVNNVFVITGAKPWLAITATGLGDARTEWLGVLPPQPQPGSGTPLGVSLFRTPPVSPARLPRFVRNSLRDPPAGRHVRGSPRTRVGWTSGC